MFELNEAIRSWREGLRRQPNFRGSDLDELEDHLREEIDGLRTSGLSDEEAFLVATRRMGNPEDLNSEFAIADPKGRREFRLSWMILGALTLILVWLAAEVLGNFAVGTIGHLTLVETGSLGMGWLGGMVRVLVLVLGAVLVWRLLSKDHGARRVAAMGGGSFFALALLLVVMALVLLLGSRVFFFAGLPPVAIGSTALLLHWFQWAFMLLLPLLLLFGLWKLIAGRK